jgi:hypothetical protein
MVAEANRFERARNSTVNRPEPVSLFSISAFGFRDFSFWKWADSVPVNSQGRLTLAPQWRSALFSCSRRLWPADVLRDDAEEWGKALPGGGAEQSRGT